MAEIPGYDFGRVPPAPISPDDFELLKKTVMWSEEDAKYLKMACEVLRDQVDQILDLWYGWVAPIRIFFTTSQTSPPASLYRNT